MGFNSVLFICNDAMGEIDNDPAGWWAEARRQLMSHECMKGETKEFGFGSHSNYFRAVWNQHADFGALIAVGGNYAQVVSSSYATWKHSDPEVLKRLLEDAADKLGYRLVKKPQKREKVVEPEEDDIRHNSDDARCTCSPCPPDRDDMFWRQDEEAACERRYEYEEKKK